MNKTFKYKFSIIISIYNTDQWLREAVDSIINQDIGFEENIQIIMVNDGSPDNSEEICLEYQKKYPDNIIYRKKKNGGLASARNVGLRYVEGEYVNFFDPDDILSKDTLRLVNDYFEIHYEEIDLVAIKLVFFDAKDGHHGLNFKFEKDAIINLEKDYDYAQLSAASAFIKSAAIETIRFDDEIKHSEDVMFIPQVLHKKMKYGVLSKPTYYYRQRLSSSSITDNKARSDYWYMVALPKVHMFLIEFSLKNHGKVLKFIQYVILYHIAGEVMGKLDTSILTKGQLTEYKDSINRLLSYIDDDVIMRERHLYRTHKIYLLGKRHNENSLAKLSVKDGHLTYRGAPVYKLRRFTANIEIISMSEESVTLEGFNNGIDIDDIHLYFSNNKNIYPVEYIDSVSKPMYFIDELIYVKRRFRVNIPITKFNNIQSFIMTRDGKRHYVNFDYRKYTGLEDHRIHAYKIMNSMILLPLEKNLIIRQSQAVRVFWREIKRSLALIRRNKFNLFTIRLVSRIAQLIYHKPIWIISDRLVCGRDNGEALFRYISTLKDIPANVYFAVNRDSEDYKRLQSYGKVLDRQSIKYKIIFLLSDKVVSSHFDDFVTNPFGTDEKFMSDVYRFSYIFLQHGVTKDDMSPSLNKYNRNIKLLIAAAKPEYNAFLSSKYGYTEDEVVLTGFPRFDLLNNSPQNKLIIAPTWRRHIITKPKPGTDIREYDPSFKDTDYFKFYNGILTDRRILTSLKKNNMTAEFYVHPNLSKQAVDFEADDIITIKEMPYDYSTAFTEGSLLVTDYSSVAFDFGYLKKPVIYTQFDKDIFFKSHYTPGYFSYEKNGFGPVLENYEDSVAAILKSINANCKIQPKYLKRIESFYEKFDTSNAERVYKSILDL